jgi:phospholipid transport system substrate-binding protein
MERIMRNSRMSAVPILVLLISWGVAAAVEEAADDPVIVIETRATALAEKLQGRQDYYSANNQELYGLVRNILLPGFDVDYASKLVLGRAHWTAASAAQRSAFIDAFYGFLVRSYGKGLLGFNQEDLKVFPETYSKDGKKAEVKTEITLDNGTTVPVNYRLRNANGDWKVYDVRIQGVSYVQNYRSQFNAEISATGIDAVIVRLETDQEDEPAIATEET